MTAPDGHRVELTLGRSFHDPIGKVEVDGVDVTGIVRGLSLSCRYGELTTISLELAPSAVLVRAVNIEVLQALIPVNARPVNPPAAPEAPE